jgi:hypothetical protein
MKLLSNDEYDLVLVLRDQGMSTYEIQQATHSASRPKGIAHATICNVINGIYRNPRDRKPTDNQGRVNRERSAKNLERAIEILKNPLINVSQLSRLMDVSRPTALKYWNIVKGPV